MASFLIIAALIGVLVAGFLAVRRDRRGRPEAPVEEGEVVAEARKRVEVQNELAGAAAGSVGRSE